MELVRAKLEDLDAIAGLYDDVIDKTENMHLHARWKKGLHPTTAGIREYIAQGAMYLYMDDEKIAGAMAITTGQGEDYRKISWGICAEDDETAVVHILGVNPEYQGKGVAKRMMDASIRLARDGGKKALRLDALATNTPAQRLYLSKGFAYRGKQNLYAENTGWTDFYFYEYIL